MNTLFAVRLHATDEGICEQVVLQGLAFVEDRL
jgi:hypothetical protein